MAKTSYGDASTTKRDRNTGEEVGGGGGNKANRGRAVNIGFFSSPAVAQTNLSDVGERGCSKDGRRAVMMKLKLPWEWRISGTALVDTSAST